MSDPTLHVLDATYLVHLAYHAVKDRPGHPLKAFGHTVAGFLRRVRPTHVVAAVDRLEPTWRKQLYPRYKSGRPDQPAALQTLFQPALGLLDTGGIQVYAAAGYEGDDVIAGLTFAAVADGYHVVIVTADTDLQQLISERVAVLVPRTAELVTLDTFRAAWSLEPYQLPEVMALEGGKNGIPGVSRVGREKALKLIRHFGSVAALYNRLQEVFAVDGVGPLIRDHLSRGRQDAELSLELARLRAPHGLAVDLQRTRIDALTAAERIVTAVGVGDEPPHPAAGDHRGSPSPVPETEHGGSVQATTDTGPAATETAAPGDVPRRRPSAPAEAAGPPAPPPPEACGPYDSPPAATAGAGTPELSAATDGDGGSATPSSPSPEQELSPVAARCPPPPPSAGAGEAPPTDMPAAPHRAGRRKRAEAADPSSQPDLPAATAGTPAASEPAFSVPAVHRSRRGLTDEQLAMRQTGLGASEVAAVCGLNPYATPADVYVSKVDGRTKERTFAMEWGSRLEHVILERYLDDYPDAAVEYPGTLRHPERDWALATPDAIVDIADQRRLVEIKTTSQDWESLPTSVACQVHWQHWVASAALETSLAEVSHVPVLALGREYHVWECTFDADLLETLIAGAERFWKERVLVRRPPTSYDDKTLSSVAKALGKLRATSRVERATDSDTALLQSYWRWQERYELAREARDKLMDRLRCRIGDASGLQVEGAGQPAATWRNDRDRLTVDWEAIARSLGATAEVIRAYTTTAPGARKLLIKRQGET